MGYRIAVLVSDWNYEVVSQYFTGIQKFANEHSEYTVHIFDDFGIYGSTGDEDGRTRGGMEIFNLPDLSGYDGIMIEGDQGWPAAMRQRIVDEAAKKPVASLNYPLEGCTYVGTDNYAAIRELTEHLITVHHIKRPAFIKGYEKSQEAVDRRHAFEDACRAHGIAGDDIRLYGGTWLMETGTEAAEQMLSEQKKGASLPDAVVCCNDDLAVGAARVFQSAGLRIPEDIIVTGFDNLDVAKFYSPRITTVSRDYTSISCYGMQYICDVIEGRRSIEENIYSPFKIIYTKSCGCPESPVSLEDVESRHLSMSQHLRMLYSLQNSMENAMMRSENIQEIMGVFEEYAGVFGCPGMYLVMNPNYLDRYSGSSDPSGYAETMRLMAVYNTEGAESGCDPATHVYSEFSRDELLPERYMKNNSLMVFYPLHHEDDNIGYVALDGISPASRFNILEVMLMLVANAIESVFSYEYITDINKKLERISERDPLTGLYNRFGFNRIGRKFCEKWMREGGAHYYFVDMDDMKYINDTYDHDTGDRALRLVAGAVEKVSKKYGGFCMRYGGDEFLIVTGNRDIVMEKELSGIIAENAAATGFPCELGVSVGEFRSEEYEKISVDACISHADDRMYYRKNLKKNEGVIGREYDTTDDLTGLLTMRGFRKQADSIMKRIGELGRPFSIAYFNIINFKNYNNRHGFEEGDRLLKKVASVIQSSFPNRTVGRFGSDRFAVMAFDYELEDGLEKIHAALEREEKEDSVSLKTGICSLRPDDTDCINACDRAKTACESISKNYGRNVRRFDDELRHETEMQNYVLTHLDDAIEDRCIEVFFQTIMDCRTEKPCSSEALARWRSPAYGLMPPISFISVLEDYHVIHKLDLEIVRQICMQIKEVERAGAPEVPVSCNLSRYDFAACDIFSEIEKIMNAFDIPRRKMHIEVTESTIVSDPGFMKRELQKFRDAGYEIWMDDFGSGYSSFNVLKDFDFDVIKIDMAFLSNMSEKSKKIIESVINMAKSIGMRTLTEGVETRDQFEFLRDAGCDMAQGYLFSKPHRFDMESWKKRF